MSTPQDKVLAIKDLRKQLRDLQKQRADAQALVERLNTQIQNLDVQEKGARQDLFSSLDAE